MEASQTRDQTCVPCIGRQILIHCTIGEVLNNVLSILITAAKLISRRACNNAYFYHWYLKMSFSMIPISSRCCSFGNFRQYNEWKIRSILPWFCRSLGTWAGSTYFYTGICETDFLSSEQLFETFVYFPIGWFVSFLSICKNFFWPIDGRCKLCITATYTLKIFSPNNVIYSVCFLPQNITVSYT